MIFRSSPFFLILLIGPALVNPAYADDFSKARKLLQENQAKQAYEYLVHDEGYHMGEPDYDLLLASTALAAGYPHEAIFAYERVLIHTPNNLMARIEMAVAYFRIDELENAQRHLNMVLAARPGGEVRKTLDQYAQLINEKIASRKNDFSGSHAFRQGWDSNINSATNESEIKLAIGNYRPTEGVDKETSDTFSELINRLNYEYHVNVNSHFFSSAGYGIRENNTKQFDTQTADIKLGYQQSTGIGKFSFPLSYQTIWLDEKQLREVTSIGASLDRTAKPSFTNYTIQYGEIRYPGQAALNVDQIVLSYVIGSNDNKATVNPQYALFYGDETETNSLYRFNARTYMGIQIRLPIRVENRHYLIPRLVYQQAEHKSRHPFFLENRKDSHFNAVLDWNWHLDRHWQINGQLSHAINDSTVNLYTYERTSAFFGFTYKY